MRQRTVAGAEIVEAERHALIFETGDDRADERQVFEQRASGDLDLELAWSQAGFDEQLDQLLAEPGVLQLLGRDVDRERDRRVPDLGVFKDRMSVVQRKSVSVRVDLVGSRIMPKHRPP